MTLSHLGFWILWEVWGIWRIPFYIPWSFGEMRNNKFNSPEKKSTQPAYIWYTFGPLLLRKTFATRMYGLAVMLPVATLNICQILMRFLACAIYCNNFMQVNHNRWFVYSWTLTVPRSHVESCSENIPHISSISFTASIFLFFLTLRWILIYVLLF